MEIQERVAEVTVDGIVLRLIDTGGPLLELSADGKPIDVINVFDYELGTRREFDLCGELSDWVAEHSSKELVNLIAYS